MRAAPDTAARARRASSLIGLLYWKPLHSYLHTRAVLKRREAEVSRLQPQQKQLQTADRDGRLGRRARARGAAARAREAGRAALHRPRHRRLAPEALIGSPAPGASSNLGSDGRSRRRRAPARARAARVPARGGALPVRPAGRRRADAVRRRRHAVPDPVLAHLPAPRGADRPARGGRRGRRAGRRAAADDPALRGEPRARAGGAARAAAGAAARDRRRSTRTGSLKCLHAHAAFALARPGYELGERILAEAEPLWPQDGCCSTRMIRA